MLAEKVDTNLDTSLSFYNLAIARMIYLLMSGIYLKMKPIADLQNYSQTSRFIKGHSNTEEICQYKISELLQGR